MTVFDVTDRSRDLRQRLLAFMDEHIYPNDAEATRQINEGNRWEHLPLIDELKPRAQEAGLWNLFLPPASDPDGTFGPGLSNLEYAPLCEVMGRVWWAPEVFNCAAPDTGNMEVLARYGTPEQQQQWLIPLLNGEIRSAFSMTEHDVASSDATNIESSITRDGEEYVINGEKWWTSGAGDPRCAVSIFMGKTDPSAERHLQQSMILVPMDAPGVTKTRMLTVFGYDDAPHGHAQMTFKDVRVPASALLLGEGRGFEIAQGRLGPGRIHHCMRLIGQAERALELMVARASSRVAFGKPLAAHQHVRELIAQSRMEIDQARLLTMNAAHMMDTVGNKEARGQIAAIKVVAPNMALAVIDRAIQVFGGAGVSQDTPLAMMYAQARTLRLADGPDIVHIGTVAKEELRRQGESARGRESVFSAAK
ncbi:acyl-CoA dehydrogenase family protein [Deinococcus radiopugnans]|uniref:Acyl-CoA dehydrogenase n=1 Tax=Deinococcus radiopugnans ATCC 19172 TaxID=585398 RepID=A0A5C4YCK0_9DEIO|nr:acyl-CoA dehydrogenase family protein [Deinococcus radiopugnans]MBB6015459.1 acyl-CoA dehydrogenase [Deinococcus radiopugnans ATCC 19172]TNM72859.1 acyl-CoA dehydrogenase [Deinococcus radiopugnans ATCC 19172]